MKHLILWVLLLLFSSCIRLEPPHIVEADRALRFGKMHARSNELYLIGEGGSMLTNIKEFSLMFTTEQKLSVELARSIIVEEVQSLLNFINTDEKIFPYLNEYPFTVDNIDYTIMCYDEKTNAIVCPPLVALVYTMEGKVFYKIYHIDRKYGQRYETIHEETFEEALKKVNQQASPSIY